LWASSKVQRGSQSPKTPGHLSRSQRMVEKPELPKHSSIFKRKKTVGATNHK
jgi:hypothetical protein